MARLYKMTVYVADLEEDSSLDEIENLIENEALNGCTINVACKFADEKEAAETVKWEDGIDINQISATPAQWDKYFK